MFEKVQLENHENHENIRRCMINCKCITEQRPNNKHRHTHVGLYVKQLATLRRVQVHCYGFSTGMS